jgi:hypothetical protein
MFAGDELYPARTIGLRVQPQADIITELRMIDFQCQNVIGIRPDDFCGDGFLAAHGIDSHHCTFQVQALNISGMAVISPDLPSPLNTAQKTIMMMPVSLCCLFWVFAVV